MEHCCGFSQMVEIQNDGRGSSISMRVWLPHSVLKKIGSYGQRVRCQTSRNSGRATASFSSSQPMETHVF